jgi:tetratricopeptide (TPR) repeat protein
MRRLLADWLNHKGNKAADAGQCGHAIRFYEMSAKVDPSWSVPQFNLGLHTKFLGRWQQRLLYNQRAVQLNPADEGAWWNLGIAATALGDWPRARQAWKSVGIDVPPGEAEWTWPPVLACVRINPNNDGEVVWGDRIDPARIVISNVPLPESNRRFRDIVLHDGASNGTRTFEDSEVPVFDELDLWQSSSYATYQVTLHRPNESSVATLSQICETLGLGFEDWSTRSILCKQCSHGDPGPHACSNSPGQYRIAIAAQTLHHAEQAIEEWRRQIADSSLPEIELLLAPA